MKFNAGVKYKDKLILSSIEVNGLWVYDLILDKIVLYKKFEQEEASFAIHRKAFLYNDEAWFIPQYGNKIAIVDLNNYDISYIEIPFKQFSEEGLKKLQAKTYDGGLFNEHYLYTIPTGIDALNIIDLRDRSVQTFYNVNNNEVLMHGFFYENKICAYSEDLLVKRVDIKTGNVEIISCFKDNDKKYGTACLDASSKRVYLAPLGNVIAYIDLQNMQKHEIELPESIMTECTLDYGEEIIFWGARTDAVVILNKRTQNVEIRRLDTVLDLKDIIYIPVDSDEEKIAFSRNRQRWYRYLPKKNEFEDHLMCIDFDDVRMAVERETIEPIWKILKPTQDGILSEGNIPLEYFLEKIVLGISV
jgi:hypothetical protein